MDQTTQTSKIAGTAHAAVRGKRRQQILDLLRDQPLTLWESARALGVFDHQISGVFTALCSDGFIERSGDRRNKPETGCPADVWRIRDARSAVPPTSVVDLAEQLGYPHALKIDGEIYDRQELLPAEGYPGIPYARRADNGGLRLVVRVDLIPCPKCGRPIFQTDAVNKVYSCTAADCGYAFKPKLVQESGRAPMLALVKER